MHALTLAEGTTYPVWFGGSYDEHWSEDYSLFISYRNRRFVNARLTGDSWIPFGGDAALCAAIVSAPRDGMIRRYFNAAVEVYAASQECLRRAVPLTRIYELFSFREPLAAPELLRLLTETADRGGAGSAARVPAPHGKADRAAAPRKGKSARRRA